MSPAVASTWEPPLNLSPVTADVDEAREWFDTFPAAGIDGLVVKGAGQRYAGGERQWLKVKRRDTLEVVAAAVIGPITRPETIVVGLPVDGELRILGRSTPLRPAAARALAEIIRPAGSEHPWPRVVNPAALDRFNAGRDPVELTLIDPLVVEISAGIATSSGSFRHAVRFVRARPDVDPVEAGE